MAIVKRYKVTGSVHLGGTTMKKAIMTVALLFATALLLVACNDDSEEKDIHENENQSAVEQVNGVDDDESTDEAENSQDASEKEDANHDETERESEQEKYLAKLDESKKETDEMRENPRDGTTFAMKEVEGNLYVIWDDLLNDIYGELEEQLSTEEMDELREEQRDWIDHRDATAKEESLKYKGGTAEQLEYVMVENNLTIERCFELVEEYMQ